MKTCPDCGCRVYTLGCVNCNEEAYIAEQVALDGPAGGAPDAADERSADRATSESTGTPMITADDLDNLRHMLGVSDRCRRGYRNYFIAGGDDVASMERLRVAGFVIRNEHYRLSADACYHATLEGARAVGLKALPR